jgi:CSLREA domain-containing protein
MTGRQRRRREKRLRHRSRPTASRLAAGAGLTVGATLAAGGTAQAADFTVNSSLDPGGTTVGCDTTECTLREAITAANGNGNNTPDNILFASSLSGSTITLASDLPTITDSLSIDGLGASALTVDGDGNGIFDLDHGPTDGTLVSISGLTLTGGYDYSGGAIDNHDFSLTVSDSVITGNNASFGGGIGNRSGGTLYLHDSILTDNTATGGGGIDSGGIIQAYDSTISGNHALGSYSSGGGINQYDGATTHLYDSDVSGNDAGFGGGGINNRQSILYLVSTTVGGNSAGTLGAGISTYESDTYLEASTVYGNYDANYGGGISSSTGATGVGSDYANLNIANSTISYNYASGSGNYPAGGGISVYHEDGPISLSDTTVAGNGGAEYGGGISAIGSVDPTLYNTIVANNSASIADPDLSNFSVAFDASFTLVEDPDNATITEGTAGSNILGVDPQLAALATNGGSTQTQALAPTSPAVDKGASDADFDQRGATRPFDFDAIPNSSATGADASDMGAFELQPSDIPAAAGPVGGASGVVPPPKCKGKTATVFRAGSSRTLTGTSKKDVIVGTSKRDSINGRGGNDLVCAKGGNDKVKGGGGKDKLLGQGGKDKLAGGAKKDKLIGGAKADKLIGGAGNDTCVGGAGKDTLKSC